MARNLKYCLSAFQQDRLSYRLLNKKARKLMLYKKYHQNQHNKAAFHKIFFLKKLKNKINMLLLKYQYFYLS